MPDSFTRKLGRNQGMQSIKGQKSDMFNLLKGVVIFWRLCYYSG